MHPDIVETNDFGNDDPTNLETVLTAACGQVPHIVANRESQAEITEPYDLNSAFVATQVRPPSTLFVLLAFSLFLLVICTLVGALQSAPYTSYFHPRPLLPVKICSARQRHVDCACSSAFCVVDVDAPWSPLRFPTLARSSRLTQAVSTTTCAEAPWRGWPH